MAFKATGLPPQKVDANGTSLFERFPEAGKQPEKLLDFPGLPDQVVSLQFIHRRYLTDHRLEHKKPGSSWSISEELIREYGG